ncbi:hypothetical protein EZV63_32025 [Streptomyces sp. VN1]|nr:hypothetical protein EZV63_32025 [Streptomyces sp. VN1]
MVERPCLRHPGVMSAEGIGCPEHRVHRPFHGRSTSLGPAFAAIIIVDPGPAPQTAPPDRASRASPGVGEPAHRVGAGLGPPVAQLADPEPPHRSHSIRQGADLHNIFAGQGT